MEVDVVFCLLDIAKLYCLIEIVGALKNISKTLKELQ